MAGEATVPATGSGRPFENVIGGALLASGFIVDVDVRWREVAQPDIAQFDVVASGIAGSGAVRFLIECKGGGRWGYGDAFQLLGKLRASGAVYGVLLVARRRSSDDLGGRTAAAIERLVLPHGVYVIDVTIDDRRPLEPLLEIGAMTQSLYARGLVPAPEARPGATEIEVCTRSVARLRGAIDRLGETFSHPLGAANPPGQRVLASVQDWKVLSLPPGERVTALRRALSRPIGSQRGWDDMALTAHPRFARDMNVLAAYAGAQEMAALSDAARHGWMIPPQWDVPRVLRAGVRKLDLHALAHAAYLIALLPPSSDLARRAREAHGSTIAMLTSSKPLRGRCRADSSKDNAAAKASRTGRVGRRGVTGSAR